MRAPLRAIDGFSRMLEHRAKGRLDDEDQRLLRVVRESSQIMGRLIDDLLHFSRVSRIVPQNRPFDMNLLVREVWQELMNDPYPGRIAFTPLPSVSGDAALFRQVWSNLLSNAIKYTGRAPDPEIRVWGEVEDGEARYHVRDNGAGFNPRFSNKLFQVFQRLHTNTEFPGNGVGLAIVARVVGRHGGRVWAEGEPDHGAFSVSRFPWNRMPESHRMNRLIPTDVLLVEDNPLDAEMTMHSLQAQRIANHIVWVKDGEEALDYLLCQGGYREREPTAPRLVLLDLKLPKIDGLEVLSAMKADSRLQKIPVVMLTSSAEESDLIRSYDLGVNSYVVKPVDFDSFSVEVGKLGFYWLLINRSPTP